MRNQRRSLVLLGAAVTTTTLIGALTTSAAAAPAPPPLPDLAEALGINNSNVAVGDAYTVADQQRAVRWSAAGDVTDLGTLPGGTYSTATAINSWGEIVGTSGVGGSDLGIAVRWSPAGQISALPSLPSALDSDAETTAVNDLGFIVGFERVAPNYDRVPLRWSPNGSLTQLAHGADADAAPTAINDFGVAVGTAGRDAVRWDANGTMSVLLPPPGDTVVQAFGINNLGYIFGDGISSQGGQSQVLEWDPAGQVHVIANDTYPVVGSAINDVGVGLSWDQISATTWYPGGHPVALRSPYPNPEGTYSPVANAINDRDVTVGRSVRYSSYAIRWSPDGSPTVLPGLGLQPTD